MIDLKHISKPSIKIESLLNAIRRFNNDLKKELSLDNCATLELSKGKTTKLTQK